MYDRLIKQTVTMLPVLMLMANIVTERNSTMMAMAKMVTTLRALMLKANIATPA